MKKRVGILTSGGDCPGLNAAIRGAAKALYETFGDEVEIVGILNGYTGLINGDYKEMNKSDFYGILPLGGTILGTSRQPFKTIQVVGADGVDKVANMIKTYNNLRLDCLLTLGGNGTHKTANLLSQKGLNVIGLPKTIDNDIFGTDRTFGFHTAVDIASEVLDRLHTTATSHSRVIVVECMGNKVGWLSLFSGIAGGADVILLPELPFSYEKVAKAVLKRKADGRNFAIVLVAEGALSKEEETLKRKTRVKRRGGTNVTPHVTQYIAEHTGIETRSMIPGHYLRGGTPSAYDRVLATEFGAYAAKLIKEEKYGLTVALKNDKVTCNRLEDIAGKAKPVPKDYDLIQYAKSIGISFCEG